MSSSRRSYIHRLSLGVASLAAGWVLSSGLPAKAQAEPPRLAITTTAQEVESLIEAANRGLNYVPYQVVVKFKDGVGQTGQQRALMALRSRPAVADLKWVGPVAIVTDLGQPDATILATQLREQPEIQYAEPNYLRHSAFTPNDPSFSSRQWNFQVIDLPRAWDISPGASSNIVVAVVDTGITTTNATFSLRTWGGTGFVDVPVAFGVNPDLSGSRLVSPWDFAFSNSSTVLDMGGHGTHVSSTVGEDTNNAIAEAGIAYNVKIMPVKVLACYWDVQFAQAANNIPGFYDPPDPTACTGTSTNVAQGIRYAADNGAKIINLSLGGTGAATIEQDAIKYAVSKGAFVAIAAGNGFEDGNPVEYPARFAQDIDGAMAVAAVGRSLRHAYYSSAGSYVEIAAPGGDDRDGGTSGMIWQSTLLPSDSDPFLVLFPRFDRYAEVYDEGTSMASPHVAGIAALIMSRLGSAATPAIVERIIKATARPCDLSGCNASTPPSGTAGRNDLFGFGLIQPRAALLGFGFAR